MVHRRKGFITANYEELLDSSVKMRDCLPPAHLARIVVDVVSQLDLSRLYARYDIRGAVAYAPKILLGLLFYSYASGVFDSREIEKATYESIPFRYLAGGLHPDHQTLTNFRRELLSEIREAFVQILIFARTAGLLRLGHVNLDRSSIYENGTDAKEISYERLLALKAKLQKEASALLARAEKADQRESPRYLVVEAGSAFRDNPRTCLATARSALEACVREHRSGERRARGGEAPPSPSTDQPAVAVQASNASPSHSANGRQKPGAMAPLNYNCRICSVRMECIEAKTLGPGAKLAMANMFASHTDTVETWAKLQQDCLVEQQRHRARPDNGLSWRLRKIRQKPERAAKREAKQPEPTRESEPAPPPRAAAPTRVPCPKSGVGLTLSATERRVRLPHTGAVILGRYEHGYSNYPDVDLTFDDGLIPSVSRRHAQITASNGVHWLEDLGSANGTYVNGYQMALGERVQLNPGDRILLGRCRIVFGRLPDLTVDFASEPHLPTLTITHTGQSIELPDLDVIVVGRSDSSIGYTPDVDLSVAGEVAKGVSRRHARITTQEDRHYLLSAGGAVAVALNGQPVQIGDAPALLQPGDQLSLGGCVLAYEWKRPEEQHAAESGLLARVDWQSLATCSVPTQAVSG